MSPRAAKCSCLLRASTWLGLSASLVLAISACDSRKKDPRSDGGGGIDGTAGGSIPVDTEGGNGGGETGEQPSGNSEGSDVGILPDDSTGGGGTEEQICDSVFVDLKQEPTKLMLVLDKSGSMVKEDNKWDHDGDGDGPGTTPKVTRWFSLHDVVAKVTEKFDSSINFGAQLYPAVGAGGANQLACKVGAVPEVNVQPQSRQAILKAIPAAQGQDGLIAGGTPALAGFSAARDHLLDQMAKEKASGKESMFKPAIVLVTDGSANCGMLDDEECKEFLDSPAPPPKCGNKWFNTYDERIHSAVKKTFEDNEIKTYVIGIGIKDEMALSGPQVNPHEKLNQLATEGGTDRAVGDAKYFSADNHESLLSALDEIATSVRSCDVEMTAEISDEKAEYVSIKIKNNKVPELKGAASCDGQDGWRWDHSNGRYKKLELCGSFCSQLKVEAAIDVEIGCPPPA